MNKKILIIDDDRIFSQISKQHLLKAGFSVSILENGNDAIKSLSVSIPDLVVLDIIMPGTNGFDVLKALNDKGVTEKVPIIICSQLAQEKDIQETRNLGAIDYLVKDNNSEKRIFKKINEYFSRPQTKEAETET